MTAAELLEERDVLHDHVVFHRRHVAALVEELNLARQKLAKAEKLLASAEAAVAGVDLPVVVEQ